MGKDGSWCKYYGTIHRSGYLDTDGCTIKNDYCEHTIDADEDCSYFEDKYSSSSGGCFMTSACVSYMGKEDDCVELETLRKFRDTKLKKYKCGQSLINEYYLVAPSIVESIEKSPKKDKYYQDIYDLVCQCVDKVNENKDDEAIDIYLRMFYKYRIIFDK